MRNGYMVIDADGHVNEDADGGHALATHLEARFKDRVIRRGGDPRDRGQGGKYGKRHGDPAIHIEDMDLEGIDVAVLYPTKLLAVCKIEDHEYAVALCRAYNDWLAKFCAYSPDRLKGVAALPMVEPQEAARELERGVTQLGHLGGMAQPYAYNHKVGDDCYDDLYACAQQLDVPIGFHAGGESPSLDDRFDTFLEAHTMGHTVEQMAAATLISYSGILEKFPRLRVAFLEGLVGWVPMLAERMDEEYEKRPFEASLLTRPPSEYFKSGRVFFGAEPGEWMIPTVIRFLGSDASLLYSSDYPHWDGDFPNSTRTLLERDDLTDENKRNIIGANAGRFYPALAQVAVPA